MKKLSKIIFAALVTVFAVISFAACAGTTYNDLADIKITVLPAAAEVDVISADGSVFTKEGNVYTLKNTPVKSYQISVLSKEGAAEVYAPQVINIPRAELTDGLYEKTVTAESAKEFFVAEITVQGAVATTKVEGLGAEWIKTSNRYRAKVEKNLITNLNRTIVISAENCEPRSITIDSATTAKGYYFNTVRLGLSNKSYRSYTYTSDDNESMGGVEVISLLTGKKYNAQAQEQWVPPSTRKFTLWVETDKNDYVQLSFNYGSNFYIEKFRATEVYADDTDLTAEKDTSLKKVYVNENMSEDDKIYYSCEGRHDAAKMRFEYDSSAGRQKKYIMVPQDADLYMFEGGYRTVVMDEWGSTAEQYMCFKRISKAPQPATLTLNSFRYYDAQGQVTTEANAVAESVTVKIKNMLSGEYIPFSLEYGGTDAESQIFDMQINSFYSENEHLSNSCDMKYFSITDAVSKSVNGVYVHFVMPKDLALNVHINTLGELVTVTREPAENAFETFGVSYDYSIEAIGDRYARVVIYVRDEISMTLSYGERRQTVYLWYDEFNADRSYKLNLWFTEYYETRVTLTYNGMPISFTWSNQPYYDFVITTANKYIDSQQSNLSYMSDYSQPGNDTYYFTFVFKFMPGFDSKTDDEPDMSVTIRLTDRSSGKQTVYNLKIGSLSPDSHSGEIFMPITFVSETSGGDKGRY